MYAGARKWALYSVVVIVYGTRVVGQRVTHALRMLVMMASRVSRQPAGGARRASSSSARLSSSLRRIPRIRLPLVMTWSSSSGRSGAPADKPTISIALMSAAIFRHISFAAASVGTRVHRSAAAACRLAVRTSCASTSSSQQRRNRSASDGASSTSRITVGCNVRRSLSTCGANSVCSEG